ncbi:MAG: large conductance mechanosensitive channel protein MscL [SAR202 cluster bacterium]|nr:large conductance mechanosensitive channel protein MscL [SAR202 cluster bacterium]
MLSEFQKFLLRGNVIQLAIAVVIGAAFGAVVKSAVEDLITPLIGILGNRDFSGFVFTVNGSTFRYGNFVNALLSFIVVAAVVFFLVVKPMNAFMERTRNEPKTADPTTRKCPECLSEIPIAAKRCAHCASVVEPVQAG